MPDKWTPPDDPTFRDDMATGLTAVFRDAAGDAIDQFDLPVDFDWTLPQAVDYGRTRGGELVGKKYVNGQWVDNPTARWVIDDEARDKVRGFVADAIKEGWSYQQFADRLEESGLFGEERANLIARTELALAQAGGKVAVYKETGVGEGYVVIYDEDQCDTDLCDVDGDIKELEWYEANPLGHPNCTRDARPATHDELVAEGLASAEEPDDEEEIAA